MDLAALFTEQDTPHPCGSTCLEYTNLNDTDKKKKKTNRNYQQSSLSCCCTVLGWIGNQPWTAARESPMLRPVLWST